MILNDRLVCCSSHAPKVEGRGTRTMAFETHPDRVICRWNLSVRVLKRNGTAIASKES